MEGRHEMSAHLGHEDRQRQQRRDQEGAPVGRDLVARLGGGVVSPVAARAD
jgi:hypothetical protein